MHSSDHVFAQADTAHTPVENANLPRPGNETNIVCIVSALPCPNLWADPATVGSGRGCVYRRVWFTPHHRGAAPPLSRACSTARLRAKKPERQSPHPRSTPVSPHTTRPDRWNTRSRTQPARRSATSRRHVTPRPFLRTPSAPAAATQLYAPIRLHSARQNRQNRQTRQNRQNLSWWLSRILFGGAVG